jgi:hypothetical protein
MAIGPVIDRPPRSILAVRRGTDTMSHMRRERKRRPAQTLDVATAPSARSGRAYAWTIAIAAAAPLVVFVVLAWATSTPPGGIALDDWVVAGRPRHDNGDGIALTVGPRPVLLVASPRAPRRASRLVFDLDVERPFAPRILVRYRNARRNLIHTIDLSDRFRRTGRTSVELGADDAPGLDDADDWAIELASPGGENRLTLAGTRLEGVPFLPRLQAMAQRFVRPEPLTRGSNNVVESTRVAGHGVLFVFWCGLGLALVALAARRWALRRRLHVLRHALLTLLPIVVLADLRNLAVDRAAQARSAIARRAASGDMIDYLGRLEADIPWFGPALRYLSEQPPDKSFAARLRPVRGLSAAGLRLGYYSAPRRYLRDETGADLLLVEQGAAAPDDNPTWARAGELPGGMTIYERRP